MKLFETLNEETFALFAARHYYSPACIDADEFHEDLKRFKYVKRLLNRYIENKVLSERLILNHLIVIFNVFGVPAGLKMMEYKMEEKHQRVLRPFYIFLNVLPTINYSEIGLDPIIVERLRSI
jgi:hypothetical protein